MHINGTIVTEFALLAAVSWGFADFIWAKASKNLGPFLCLLLASILEPPMLLIFYMLSSHHWTYNGTALIYASIAGLVFNVGGYLFLIALKKGPVSLVSPIASMYPFVTTVIALVVFHSHLTKIELLGICTVLIGIFLASDIIGARSSQLKLSYGVKLAFYTACSWGLAYSLLAQAISRIGWLNATLIEIWVSAIWVPLLIPFIRGKEEVTAKRIFENISNKFVLLAVVVNLIGFLSLNFAISKSASSGGTVAVAISACYPIITILLALNHFKEKVKPVALLGAFIGIAGVVLLSLS